MPDPAGTGERGRIRAGGRDGAVAGFYGQLAEPPPYVLDLRPVATASKSRGRSRRPVRAAASGVLLVSRAADGEFSAVARVLERVGIDVARVNADELAAADVMADPAGRAVRLDGRWLFPTVAWRRHFAPEAIEADGDGRARHLFRAESWCAAADHLVDIAATTVGSYRPGILAQIRLAERHGVAVPRTVLTTDPRRAAELLGGSRFVIKAGGRHFVEAVPGSLTGVFAAVVARDGLTAPAGPGPPVIVQEYVEHEAEFRVYCVAGRIRAFQVVKDAPADPWLRAGHVLVRPAVPPLGVARAAERLAAASSLRYCAFDFLVQDGRPVFLEMDPSGDWLWFESAAGVATVTMAVASMLRDLHHVNRPAVNGRPRSFDLLGFLTR